jgi:hypothetical protein
MPHDPVSRRQFLHNIAAGSAGAALVSAPAVAGSTVPGGLEPPLPSTMESYPIMEPGKGVALDRLKIVSTEALTDPYEERVRSLAYGIELKMGLSPEAFHGELTDAHVIFGEFSREDLAAAKQLRWIQWGAAGVEGILWPELVENPVVLTSPKVPPGEPTIPLFADEILKTLSAGQLVQHAFALLRTHRLPEESPP